MAAPTRIEAESMISFGAAMGPAIQGLQSHQNNTMVLAVGCPGCPAGNKVGNLAGLVADQPASPKQSGLIRRRRAAALRPWRRRPAP